jgi:hypothetical protein
VTIRTGLALPAWSLRSAPLKTPRGVRLGVVSEPHSHSRTADVWQHPLTARSVPARILIVEDQRLTAIALQAMVESWGYRVVGIAGAGDRALQTAAVG